MQNVSHARWRCEVTNFLANPCVPPDVSNEMPIKETLIKAFPSLDLRCEAANSFANPCDPPEVFKETLI